MHMKALCKLQSSIQMQIIHSFGGDYHSNYYYYFHCEGGQEGEGNGIRPSLWKARLRSAGSGAALSCLPWTPLNPPSLDCFLLR